MASSSQRGAALERNVPPPPVGDVNAAREPPAPDQLAALNKLLEKLVTAGMLGRHARLLELAGRAAAVAEALYTEDSLIVASLRATEANALWNMSCATGSKAEEAALERRAWALLPTLRDLLMRRVAANTLLPGTVRQEENVHGAFLVAATCRAANQPVQSNTLLQGAGQLMGYRFLIEVAVMTLTLLASRRWPRAQEASAQAFVLDALDLIPRTAGVLARIADEQTLVNIVEGIGQSSLDPIFCDAVIRKWRRPAIRNVLRSRGALLTGVAGHDQTLADFEARQRADITTIGLRECTWLSCDKVERTVYEFKQCSGCRTVWYCSPEHQMLDWGEHRKACGELDAARRAAATTEPAAQAARDVD